MLISIGNTVVLCTAIVEAQLPAYTTLSKVGLRLDWHIFCRHTNKRAQLQFNVWLATAYVLWLVGWLG